MKTNIVAFKKLILRYESITLEDLKKKSISDLTGYGSSYSCTLCLVTRDISGRLDCSKCIWDKTSAYFNGYPCINKPNEETYSAVYEAETPEDTLTAIRSRAKHMRKTLTKLGYKQPQ